MAELKKLADRKHIQMVCTTHSGRILAALPPEGRVFLQKSGERTEALPGISAEYATGLMAGKPSDELLVLVEDPVAERIARSCLNAALRRRVALVCSGSDTAVMRHLAARYVEGHVDDTCAVLDGDKASSRSDLAKQFMKALPGSDGAAKEWVNGRLFFLPGATWPEAWLLRECRNRAIAETAMLWEMPPEDVDEVLAAGLRAPKHSEIFELSRALALREEEVLQDLVRTLRAVGEPGLTTLREVIGGLLD